LPPRWSFLDASIGAGPSSRMAIVPRLRDMIGGCEGTTTGVIRLHAGEQRPQVTEMIFDRHAALHELAKDAQEIDPLAADIDSDRKVEPAIGAFLDTGVPEFGVGEVDDLMAKTGVDLATCQPAVDPPMDQQMSPAPAVRRPGRLPGRPTA
jgi:hypothetical protein